MTRDLAELLRSADGREMLEARGVTDDPTRFAAQAGSPVCVAHQVHPDLRASVVAKFRALVDLASSRSIEPLVIWSDIDRAGSDQASMAISWRDAAGELSVRLAPHTHRDREIRFVPADEGMLVAAFDRLRSWATAAGPATVERAATLERRVREATPSTLAAASRVIAEQALAGRLGMHAPSRMVSELLVDDRVLATVSDVLSAIDDVVLVFNETVAELRRAEVDPQVHPLDETYLPFYLSCPRDARRRRLRRERPGSGADAVATCRCGASFRFPLRDVAEGLEAITTTGRWSLDVTLPVYLNDVVGGTIAGRSSALYGLVLNQVLLKVLGRRPRPMLVPAGLAGIITRAPSPDSLLHDFLTAP